MAGLGLFVLVFWCVESGDGFGMFLGLFGVLFWGGRKMGLGFVALAGKDIMVGFVVLEGTCEEGLM